MGRPRGALCACLFCRSRGEEGRLASGGQTTTTISIQASLPLLATLVRLRAGGLTNRLSHPSVHLWNEAGNDKCFHQRLIYEANAHRD
jgi:hypothetical protein